MKYATLTAKLIAMTVVTVAAMPAMADKARDGNRYERQAKPHTVRHDRHVIRTERRHDSHRDAHRSVRHAGTTHREYGRPNYGHHYDYRGYGKHYGHKHKSHGHGKHYGHHKGHRYHNKHAHRHHRHHPSTSYGLWYQVSPYYSFSFRHHD